MKLFLRVWLFEREVIGVHFTTEEPVIHIESADPSDDLDREIEEFETQEEGSAALSWSSADPEDSSRLILRPEDDPGS